MTDNADTDKLVGKVTTIVPWTSGKGYFLNLDNSSSDFFGYSTCHVAEGDRVQVEFKAGTKNFSNKMQIVKIKKLEGPLQKEAAAAKKTKAVEEPAPRQHFQTASEKSAQINRAVAAKIAGKMMAVLYIPDADPDTNLMLQDFDKCFEHILKKLEM